MKDLQLISQMREKATGANIHAVRSIIFYLDMEDDPIYKYQDHVQKVKDACRVYLLDGDLRKLQKVAHH